MIAYLSIKTSQGRELKFSTEPLEGCEASLIIEEEEMFFGEEGGLPGAGFPTPREVSFGIFNNSSILTKILHQNALLFILYKDKSYLISKGIINDVSLDVDGTITGRLSRTSSQRLYPDPSRLIDKSSFPRTASLGTVTGNPLLLSIGDGALGKFQPTVIGRPGALTSNIVKGYTYDGSVPGSPAYLVESTGDIYDEDQVFLIASHPVMASEVVLFNSGLSNGDDAERIRADALVGQVSYSFDNRGQGFSFITVSTLVLKDYVSKGDSYFIKWIDSAGDPVEGGLPNPYGLGPLRGAGDVIRWCADQSGLSFKPTKKTILANFNDISIDTYLNEPVDTWSWALQNIIQNIPAISVVDADGVWLAPIPKSFNNKSLSILTIGDLDDLLQPITFTNSESLASSVVINYAPSENVDGGYCKQLIFDSSNVLKLKENLTKVGEKTLYFELPAIYDDGSAGTIGKWLAQWYGSTWAYATYKLSEEVLVSVGDLVWLEAFDVAGLIYSWKVDSGGKTSVELIFPLK
jgi:hypothetical protein